MTKASSGVLLKRFSKFLCQQKCGENEVNWGAESCDCVCCLRTFSGGEKSHESVSWNSRGTFKSCLLLDSLYFQNLFLFLNFFSVSVVLHWLSVNPSRWGAVLGSVGCSSGNSCCPFLLLRHLQEGLSWSKMWLEEGRGILKCFGRMSKTLETLINSHFSLFAAFLLERQKEGRECDSWQMGCEDL